MTGEWMQLALYGFAAAALAYGALAVRLAATGYWRSEASAAARPFLLAIAATALWAAAGVGAAWAPDLSPPLLLSATDLARYVAWFWFLLVLLRPEQRLAASLEAGLLRPAAFVLAGFAGVAMALAAFVGGELVERLSLFASLALPVFGLLLVEQLFRNIDRDGRWGAKPLCLGLGVLFVFDLYIYSQAVLFGQFDEDAFRIRAAIHALAVPLLFVAARRQADWRTRLKVSHEAAFFSATLLLAGLYLLLVSGIGYYVRFFGGSWGGALQLALLISALVFLALLVFSGSLRARLRVFIGKNFFAYRYDYRQQWLRFTSLLSAPASPQEMGLLVAKGLAELVESPGASLWTLASADAEFVETARTRPLVAVSTAPADGELKRFLADQGWIIDVAECRRHPDRYPGLTLPDWIAGEDQVWAVVPLIVGERLTGIVLLAPPHASTELDWEVRDLLKTASRQAAAFLAQLQAAEALLEARKFEAFNRMSAFVVHDLKNIVTQLSLMMKNAQRLHDNPEFQKDMLMTVESSLDKMRQLMLQLREGEAPPGGPAGVDLLPIVQRIVQGAAQHGRTLELPRCERVATRGHAERIERVLGHMVQNAFDATPPEGRVWIDLHRRSGQAVVVVGDTGQGMTREFVETRLFKPFSSTKGAGMGIGAYESSQYVRELGGRIEVDSEPGRGTVITVVLPILETATRSDLQMAPTA
jgi:putative PEP-CTERM system histidine kinase